MTQHSAKRPAVQVRWELEEYTLTKSQKDSPHRTILLALCLIVRSQNLTLFSSADG